MGTRQRKDPLWVLPCPFCTKHTMKVFRDKNGDVFSICTFCGVRAFAENGIILHTVDSVDELVPALWSEEEIASFVREHRAFLVRNEGPLVETSPLLVKNPPLWTMNCAFCKERDAAFVKVDKKGKFYAHCTFCGARSFADNGIVLHTVREYDTIRPMTWGGRKIASSIEKHKAYKMLEVL